MSYDDENISVVTQEYNSGTNTMSKTQTFTMKRAHPPTKPCNTIFKQHRAKRWKSHVYHQEPPHHSINAYGQIHERLRQYPPQPNAPPSPHPKKQYHSFRKRRRRYPRKRRKYTCRSTYYNTDPDDENFGQEICRPQKKNKTNTSS